MGNMHAHRELFRFPNHAGFRLSDRGGGVSRQPERGASAQLSKLQRSKQRFGLLKVRGIS